MVVDYFIVWFIIHRGSMCLCDRQTDGIRESLTERTRGNFDALRIMGLWVTRRYTVNSLVDMAPLMRFRTWGNKETTHAESLDIIKGHFIAKKMQERIL